VPTILLIRHAQAVDASSRSADLSERGRRQAELLAEALRRRDVRAARLLSGPLPRQLETAARLGQPGVDERWSEYDAGDVFAHHGDSAGERERSLEAVLADWVASGSRSPCAQSWPEFAAGAGAALAALAAELGRGETAVVVSSAGTIAAVAAAALGAAEAAFPALSRVSVNASITTLAVSRSATSLIAFNDHAHLAEVDRSMVTFR
jgi:broad specificity phosphatase PhoE